MAGQPTKIVTLRRADVCGGGGGVTAVNKRVSSNSGAPVGPAAAASLPSAHSESSRPRWLCDVCGKLLSSKRSYDEHLNIHAKARPFCCEHCDYAAASQMTLRRHKLRNHTPRRDWGYKCPYCPEAYMEPASYQQHVSSRHAGRSATFGCPFTTCQFFSKCSKHFREHLTKHHNCVRVTKRPGMAGSSSSLASMLSDNNLERYLIDDDIGIGYNRRMASRSSIRVAPPSTSLAAASASASPTVSSEQGREVASGPPPVLVPVIQQQLRPQAHNNRPRLIPGGGGAGGGTQPFKELVLEEDDDFMKTPIAVMPRRTSSTSSQQVRVPTTSSTVLPPPFHRQPSNARGLPPRQQRVTVAPPPPPSPQLPAHTCPIQPVSAITEIKTDPPPLLSADSDWIEHEEVVGDTGVEMKYADGMVDFDVD